VGQWYLRCACERLARIFHITNGTALCRQCLGNGRYPSQRKTAADRALARFLKLRNRVRDGTQEYDTTYFPRRPQRMRKAAYDGVRAQAWDALAIYGAEQDRRLLRSFGRLAGRLNIV
jgi:uncharacterized protein involved in copper resistance